MQAESGLGSPPPTLPRPYPPAIRLQCLRSGRRAAGPAGPAPVQLRTRIRHPPTLAHRAAAAATTAAAAVSPGSLASTREAVSRAQPQYHQVTREVAGGGVHIHDRPCAARMLSPDSRPVALAARRAT